MKKLYLATAVLTFVSCHSNNSKTAPAATTTIDTATIAYPTDSNAPADTNDHNKGVTSTISLDSPIGPPRYLKDTAAKK